MTKFHTIVIACFFTGFLFFVAMFAFNKQKDLNNNAAEVANKLLTTAGEIKPATPVRYTTPVIGMTYNRFTELCNDAHDFSLRDTTNVLESASGKTVYLHREPTDKRERTGCYGSFMFRNWILESIIR